MNEQVDESQVLMSNHCFVIPNTHSLFDACLYLYSGESVKVNGVPLLPITSCLSLVSWSVL